MEIAFVIYEQVTALDAVGPYEILSRMPGADAKFVATTPGEKRTDTGSLALIADHALEDVPSPDIIVVAGGAGTRPALTDQVLLDWLRSAHETSTWTTSVCTGSLLLGAAGILDGLRATSHWIWADYLRAFGAEPTEERVVEQGKVITAAGVSSGIDMALRLVQLEAGDEVAQAIQLGAEYDPQPPLDAGAPHKAPPHIVERVRGLAESDPAMKMPLDEAAERTGP